MTAAYLAGAWLVGVAAAAVGGGPLAWEPAIAVGLLLAAAGLVLRRSAVAILALPCAALVVLGGIRFDAARPGAGAIAAQAAAGPVLVRGVILDDPDESAASVQARLAVQAVLTEDGWRSSSGGVLLRAASGTRLRYGDLVEVRGGLRIPASSAEFNYRDYLLRQGVDVVAERPAIERVEGGHGNEVLAVLYRVRRRLGTALADVLPEPQAALARGILLGQRAGIPADLADDMNAAGVSHLVAISGYNVSLVAGLVLGLLAWLIGRRQAAAVALVVVVGYTLLVGAGPPVVRAAVMGSLFLVAGMAGRPASAGTSVLLAAAAMTGWQPWVLEDVSFQLSFASTLAIVYVSVPAARWLEWAAGRLGLADAPGLRSLVVEPLAVTVSATAGTAPLIALSFHRVSLVSLAANLVLVPAFPAILFTSAAAAVAGLLSSAVGGFVGWFAWLALSFMIEASHVFAALPAAALDVSGFGQGQAAVAYIVVAVAGFLLARLPRPAPPERRPVSLPAPAWFGVAAFAVAVMAWSTLGDGGDGRLHVTVLDVGEGDAILITGPEGTRVLVDGSRSGDDVLGALGRRLGYRRRSLAAVLLTHPDQDHSGGLAAVLRRYRVGAAAAGPARSSAPGFQAWEEAVADEGLRLAPLQQGGRIDLGAGAVIDVVWPPPEAPPGDNDVSAVLRVSWEEVSFLLTADIDQETERTLLLTGAPVSAEVLKVAHHGSAGSSSSEFLAAVRPAVAVISVGPNSYGHPSTAVVERLRPAAVYRTDESGDVDVATDGRRIWVTAGR